ncbi:hypothetical protein llap_4174 [Limosa lapponica baueri]|uniref:Uncharacterized protein n=1 Tax=Limosa lapponica baueri TaxID=1758121 RepID=A0A2I0UHM3_LIMLA|nr:hypothetical protein llap_4174 [Limosa lapponica baueri]
MERGSKGEEEETRSQERTGAETGEDDDSILNSCLLSAMQISITLQTSRRLTLKHSLELPVFLQASLSDDIAYQNQKEKILPQRPASPSSENPLQVVTVTAPSSPCVWGERRALMLCLWHKGTLTVKRNVGDICLLTEDGDSATGS